MFDTDAGFQGFNLYVYCGNNPVGRIDISGTDSSKIDEDDITDDEFKTYGGGNGYGGQTAPVPESPINWLEELLNLLDLLNRTFKDGTGGLAGTYRTQPSKKHTEDQQALLELAKKVARDAKRGIFISYDEAVLFDEWASEYNIPQHHPAQIDSGKHWVTGWDHTHIYNEHVPFK